MLVKLGFVDTEFVRLMKMSKFMLMNLLLPKVSSAKLILSFFTKKLFQRIYHSCKLIFVDGYTMWLRGHVPWEGGWDTGVCRSSSI
jgi:hypothetical protein